MNNNACHGCQTTVFVIRVTDMEESSQRSLSSEKILGWHKQEKKTKYSAHCEWQRKRFTPLVFSVNGLPGKECNATSKQLASLLATKWRWIYSEVCGFVRSCLLVALVRSASQCL